MCLGCRSVVMRDVIFASCKREGVACVGCDVVELRDAVMARCGAAAAVVGYGHHVTLVNVHASACEAGFLAYGAAVVMDFVSAKGFSLCGIGCFNGATVQVTA